MTAPGPPASTPATETGTVPRARAGSLGPVRAELRAYVELLAVSGFAVAQPLLDIFGRAPDQFIFRGATSTDIIWFAILVTFGVPVLAWLAEVTVGLARARWRRPAHIGLIGAGVAAFAMQALRSITTGPALVVLAVALGVGAIAAYRRSDAARLWLRFVAVAPPIFVVLFLFGSQTSELLSNPEAAGNVRIGNRSPVVMLVFDELPLASLIDADGTLDADLYPNFAALAEESHWFRNTTTVSNFTWNAVPSLVTGRNPRDDTSPSAASHPESLFTLVGDSMGLEVTESVTRLCPTTLCATAVPKDGGLPGLLDDAQRVLGARLSPRPIDANPAAGLVEGAAPADAEGRKEDAGDASAASSDRARDFLDRMEDDSNTLHYLHVLLPHIPFRFLPDGTEYPAPEPELGRTGDTWGDDAWLIDLNRQRHLLQLAFADALVGQTMDRMRSVGMYDDAALVVVADHGMAFDPGASTRGLDLEVPLTDPVAAEIMWVPFFLKEPGQTEGQVSDDNVMTIDVMPTIADVLDIDLPWEVDGASALSGPPRATSEKGMYLAETDDTGILAGERYLIDADEGWQLVLDRAVDRFVPDGDGRERFFLVGPEPDLVGTSVGDAADGSLAPTTIDLDPASDASDVDPTSGMVPALVRGAVSGVSPGEPVAVAVDGVIRATAPAYDDAGTTRLAAMVPLEAFTAGANEISVYRITD